MIVFVEDSAQLLKLQRNYILDNDHLIFWYNGRKITNIQIHKNGHLTNGRIYHLLTLIYFIYYADEIVTEYANFIPRLSAIIFRKRLVSVIFGILTRANFRKLKFIPNKMQPLTADKYVIFGKYNPTRYLCDYLRASATVLLKDRSDLPDFRNKIEGDYILYIGQAFEKDRMQFYDDWEHKIVSELDRARVTQIYCRHPRSLMRYKYKQEINGYSECLQFIAQYGRPKLALSLSSSLIYELKEMGVNASTLISSESTHLMFTTEIDPDTDLIKPYVG